MLIVVAAGTPVLADTVIAATPSTLTVALGNALTVILMAAATAIAGVLTAVGVKLAAKLGLEATAQDKANMESEITTVLNFGINKVLPTIETRGWNVASVHDAILTAATEYLAQRFPDRVAKITAAADEPSAVAVRDTLSARLPAAMASAVHDRATVANKSNPAGIIPGSTVVVG